MSQSVRLSACLIRKETESVLLNSSCAELQNSLGSEIVYTVDWPAAFFELVEVERQKARKAFKVKIFWLRN